MPRPMLMKNARALHALKARAVHEPLGGRRVRHREDDEVGQRQERVQRVGPVELRAPRAAPRAGARRRRSRACRRPRRAAPPRAPMPPTPTISAVASGRWITPGVLRQRPPLAPELLRQVDVQPPRERQHEGHDVRADVVVVDLAEVGDDHRMRDQLRIVEPRRRRRLRRLQPPQPRRMLQQRRRQRPERRLRPRRAPAPPARRPPPRRPTARGTASSAAPPTRGSSPSAAAASRSSPCHLLTGVSVHSRRSASTMRSTRLQSPMLSVRGYRIAGGGPRNGRPTPPEARGEAAELSGSSAKSLRAAHSRRVLFDVFVHSYCFS